VRTLDEPSEGQIVYHGEASALAANEDVKRRFL